MSQPAPAILTIEGLGVRLPAGADQSHAVSGASPSIVASAWSANPAPANR
jgi:hypothetical protein